MVTFDTCLSILETMRSNLGDGIVVSKRHKIKPVQLMLPDQRRGWGLAEIAVAIVVATVTLGTIAAYLLTSK